MESKPASARSPRERSVTKPADLFTASDVARFCQVDLKTIHNWADKGEIPHFRTPGRHLRFRRLDVLDFLRKYGYALPEALRQSKPRLVLVDSDTNATTSIKRALSKRFEVTSFTDPVDALVSLSTLQPDALLLDLDMANCDGVHFFARIRSLEATAHIRTIGLSRRTDMAATAMQAGATEVLDKTDLTKLRETLEHLTGLDR